MLQKKMNSGNGIHHLCKSLKLNVLYNFPFYNWQQADKSASFRLALGAAN